MPEDMGALRDQLVAACADVADRRNEATNQDEIASLNKALAVLQTQLNLATLDALDNAANAVAEATKAIRDVTASAQTDSIQQFVDLMQEHIAKLEEISPGAAVLTPPPVAATDSPNKAAVPTPPPVAATDTPNHAVAFAEAIVQHWEGCRLTPYHGKADRPEVWTIGWGCISIDGVAVSHDTPTISQARADGLLANELAGSQAAVRRRITVPLTDYQEAALISFTYNLGEGNLNLSTLRTLLNGGHLAEAAAEFGKWIMSNNQPVKGLIRRRGAERAVFEGKVPFGTQMGILLEQFADAALAANPVA